MITRFSADATNLIELLGVGAVPRPTDLDQSKTGFEKLVSLRIYTFSQGQTIHGEAEGDEVVIVFLQGSLSITVTGEGTKTWEISGRESVFAGPVQAVYLPPRCSYRLELHTDAQVAYARARAEGRFPPRLLESRRQSKNGVEVRQILGPNEGEALECHEFILSTGSAYDLPGEAETLTHYRLESANALYADSTSVETMLEGADTIGATEPYTVTTPKGKLYGLTFLVQVGKT